MVYRNSTITILVVTFVASIAWGLTPSDAVKINEVYFAGSPGLQDDGFVELYNAGTTTAYLDGALLIQGLDTLGQIAFRFPGEPGGTTLPLGPGEFFVFAADAYDFTLTHPQSVDLAGAHAESFIVHEGPPGDNPAVMDLEELLPVGFDWFFYPRWGQVLLATGEEWEIRACQPGEVCGLFACIVPVNQVVDGIEYLYQLGDTLPRLNDAIDRSAIFGIAPQSGMSAERLAPGHDTNDSRLDFAVRTAPTPGSQGALGAIPENAPAVPHGLAITSVFPNPFNSAVRIAFDMNQSAEAELSILNILGQPVATLINYRLAAGSYVAVWNGLDRRGQVQSSGIYFARLAVQNEQAVAKVILSR